ncbi:hypothetical protein H2200_010825 [Cladophialophora chaetospira]|uniref:Aldehyde dehydrogenase domain-containing protein n=1 Tax=Cladophialophora chaetospira TaxID=386627 RepID=A0AA38X0T8_9EURO|nr:hypothetical protein H2200_010825 [Cladophialophora chaetospira]
MSSSVQRVLDAAIEGQARSPRHIQKQLSKLHATLAQEGPEIRSAIKSESQHSTAEVEVQYALALEAVATSFAASNFEKALDAEFSLSRGENALSNSIPYSVAYIVPSTFNILHGSITAVAAAISAGSCVILELPKSLSRTTELVQKTLSSSLDLDTFVIVNKRIDSKDLPKSIIRVFGNAEPDFQPTRTDLVPSSTRSIAIVDRTANTQEAAAAILRARFSFGGQSPLAPDLVLVNEFKIKEFCKSIAELTSQYFAVQVEMNGSAAQASSEKARTARVSSHELDQAGAEVLISGSRGSVARIEDRKSKLLRKRIQEPVLLIHPVRSLDDAIDFANGDGEDLLSALFAFGSPDVVKYISQFVDARVCCANNIPIELLASPSTPLGFAASLQGPYTKEMFSVPKPEFILYDKKSSRLQKVLVENDVKEANNIRREAEVLDTKVNQPAGRLVGFFEQGILLGLGIALTTIVTGNVVFWKYGFPAIKRRIR